MSESERLCSKLLNRLKDIGSAAVALSGGVDSCFLAYAASRVEGGNFAAYYVQSAFQPEFELTDALRAAKEAGLPLKIISVDILACEDVVRNPTDRCYHCKKHIFSAICKAAAADGYKTILDGTNASDTEDDRPGMRALREAGAMAAMVFHRDMPKCTHMGCRLRYFPQAQRWECPCHGSAFSILGEVRAAPAAEDASISPWQRRQR